MNDIIKIEQKDGNNLVSARELYEFLSPTERFSNWFDRLLKFGFIENIDYTGRKFFNTLAKTNLQDYILTLNMAKEISMLARNSKGKKARKYFIDCENKLKQAFKVPQTMLEALQLAVEQQKQIEAQKYAVSGYKQLISTDTLQDIGTLAKTLNTGRNRLFNFLRNSKIFMKNNLPYQNYIDNGYFVVKDIVKNNLVFTQTYVTNKGIDYCFKLYRGKNNG